MGKIFRLYKSGNNNIEGWQNSKMYGLQEIEEIKDATATKLIKAPTSIPSPFARIDIMKQAFTNVNKHFNKNDSHEQKVKSFMVNENGESTWYHQMVSDFFDVCQILFNYDLFSKIISIKEWNIDNELGNLQGQNSSEFHKIVGGSLEAYLNSDAESYHFSDIDNLSFASDSGGRL